MKKIVLIAFIALLALIAPSRGWAASDFSLAFNVEYQVQENGRTIVQKNIQLTNLTTNVYPQVYILEIPNDTTSLVAFDNGGKITPTVFEEAGRKKVKLPLNQKALGVNKAAQLVLRFETGQIAFKKGGVWKIILPKIESGEEIIAYNISLTFPQSWGKPTSIKPKPQKEFFWTYKELQEGPVILSFEKKSPTSQKNSSPKKEFSSSPFLGIFLGFFLIFASYFFLKYTQRKS